MVNGFGDNSARLNANESNRVVGPTLSLYVNAGDTVKMKAYAKYLGTPGNTSSTFVIADEVTSGFGLVSGGETAEAYSAINSLLGSGSGFLGFSSDPDLPKAYLTYHYFDTDHNYITSGFMQVSSASNGAFEELSLQLTADQQGYVYIYVGNETQDDFNVFFDDLEVEHSYGPIVQKDSYYPFGLSYGSYQRTLSEPNYFKYNGKEEQMETGWNDYGARMYMSDIGRWGVVDPLSEKMKRHTIYGYAINNPIRFEDIAGLIPWPKIFGENLKARISSAFGWRKHPIRKEPDFHGGIDLPSKEGTGIRSLANGTVTEVGYNKWNGNYIEVDHGQGYVTKYLHIKDGGIDVKEGQQVYNGQFIGQVGSTGSSTGPHLHLALIQNGKEIDPTSINDLQELLDYNDEELRKLDSEIMIAKVGIEAFSDAIERLENMENTNQELLKWYKDTRQSKEEELQWLKFYRANKRKIDKILREIDDYYSKYGLQDE